MATISIELKELGEGYVQYQSLTAEISIDNENYVLDSKLLDTEYYQADLDIIHGFIGKWEIRAEAEDLKFYIDDDVTQLIIELNVMVEDEDEAEKYNVGDEVYWNDPEGLTSGTYILVEYLVKDGTRSVVRLSNGDTELEAFTTELS